MNTTTDILVENIQLRNALTKEYLAVFHTREEIKEVLSFFIQLDKLQEAKQYIYSRFPCLLPNEVDIIIENISRELLQEDNIAVLCAIQSNKGDNS